MTAPALTVVPAEIDPRDTFEPNDLDCEGAVLSALLCDDAAGRAWQSVRAPECGLRAEHFWADANRHVFEAIEQLRGEGKQADPVMVCRVMRSRGTLAGAGGAAYIGETLACCQPAIAQPQVFAAELVELWRQRRLIEEMGRCGVLLRHGELSSEGCRAELRELFRSFK